MANNTKLSNPTILGLHLQPGASDGMLTSALYIYDETKEQSLQTTIDNLKGEESIEITEGSLNDITEEGYYNAEPGNTIEDKPEGVDDFALKVTKISDGTTQQTLYSSDGKVYKRIGDEEWDNLLLTKNEIVEAVEESIVTNMWEEFEE